MMGGVFRTSPVLSQPPGGRVVFVDETKARGFVLVASAHLVGDLAAVRRTLRGLVLPGQRRLHMRKESPRRRRAIVDTMCALGLEATVYDAGRRYGKEQAARAACFERLVLDQPPEGALLVVEEDESLTAWDRRTLYQLTRPSSAGSAVRYEHRRGVDELLLGIPDAIAWAWAQGGEWRRRIAPTVVANVEV